MLHSRRRLRKRVGWGWLGRQTGDGDDVYSIVADISALAQALHHREKSWRFGSGCLQLSFEKTDELCCGGSEQGA